MKNKTVRDCRTIDLYHFFEDNKVEEKVNDRLNLPFIPKRVFYLYNVPPGEERGGHSHMKCQQLLIPIKGSFLVEVSDSRSTEILLLDNPSFGLLISPGIWARQFKFSYDAICLVFASDIYDESDYIRDFSQFVELKRELDE